jgi:hypothetical protein
LSQYFSIRRKQNTFEQNLAISQSLDDAIKNLKLKLEQADNPLFELRNGLVYRKSKDQILFYVPSLMENQVIFNAHDKLGHVGVDKTFKYITRTYWFPSMKQKICIMYNSKSGKSESILHSILKGDKPFDTMVP